MGRPGTVRLHRAPVRVGGTVARSWCSSSAAPTSVWTPSPCWGKRLDLAPLSERRHRVADRRRGRGRARGTAEPRARERRRRPAVRGRVASHAGIARGAMKSPQQDANRYRLVSQVHDLEVPPSIHALIAARLDRLGELERSVLRGGAVLGQRFSAGRRGRGGRRRHGRRTLAARWACREAVSVRRHRSAIAVAGDVHVRAPPGGARGARHALKARAQGPSPGGRRVPVRAGRRPRPARDPGGASVGRLRGAPDRARRTRHQASCTCGSRSTRRSEPRASAP